MKREESIVGKSVACLVSVGAGNVEPNDVLSNTLKTAVEMMVGPEEEAEKFAASQEGDDLKVSGRYFRFNPPLNTQELALDECGENEGIKAAINRYIQQSNNRKTFEECVQRLASTVGLFRGRSTKSRT
jgi:hypothetical protein